MVTRTKKIFVGGLSAPTTLEDVKSYFEQFGPVSTMSSRLEINEDKYFNNFDGLINNILLYIALLHFLVGCTWGMLFVIECQFVCMTILNQCELQ